MDEPIRFTKEEITLKLFEWSRGYGNTTIYITLDTPAGLVIKQTQIKDIDLLLG